MGRPKKAIPGLLCMLFVMVACTSCEDLAGERARRAKTATGDIRVALVWQEKLARTYFFEGAEFAADEINRRGGIKGRKIRTIRYNNESASLKREREIARSIVADRDMTAVIGHYMDEGAIAASVTYEYGGIIYISPAATSVEFSQHGFQYIFRNTPSDRDNGAQLAEFAQKLGFSKIIVIDDRHVYGKGLADIFHARASKIGLNVVARRSYDRLGKDFKPLFADIKNLDFDAIFLGGGVPTAGAVIKQARIMGVTVPFFGGNGLDVPTLWKIAGQAAEGTITPTVFHHDEKHNASRAFTTMFFAKYRAYPDTWAALGYDAIQVLADAIQKSGTTVPVVVASHLRFLKDRHGVLGTYSFMLNGDITGDINRFQVLQNGRYELLEGELP